MLTSVIRRGAAVQHGHGRRLLRLCAGPSCADARWVSTRRRTITQRPIVRKSGARVHFIDDRLETLRAVSQAPDLRHVQLYLAAWCAPCRPASGLLLVLIGGRPAVARHTCPFYRRFHSGQSI